MCAGDDMSSLYSSTLTGLCRSAADHDERKEALVCVLSCRTCTLCAAVPALCVPPCLHSVCGRTCTLCAAVPALCVLPYLHSVCCRTCTLCAAVPALCVLPYLHSVCCRTCTLCAAVPALCMVAALAAVDRVWRNFPVEQSLAI